MYALVDGRLRRRRKGPRIPTGRERTKRDAARPVYLSRMPGLRVCIDVDDLDRALEFYTRALGLTPGRRSGHEWAELLGAPCPLDLLAKPPGTAALPFGTHALRAYERHWTPVHLDVVVEDLGAAVRRAVEAGAKLERDIEAKEWGSIALLSDPFGHGFCLLEFKGKGYDEILGPA
jgi:predicted enzyme related to lactoylglutathione lyase